LIMKHNFTELINRLPREIVSAMKQQEQNPKYHPEIYVYEHTRLVFENAKQLNDIDLMIAAIFHDIGKIDVSTIKQTEVGDVIVSYKHEEQSILYVQRFLHLYEDLGINEEKISWIVENHMRIHLYNNDEIKKKSKKDKLEQHKYFKDLQIFSKLDKNGR
jgi:predicted HD phosphohydrolase